MSDQRLAGRTIQNAQLLSVRLKDVQRLAETLAGAHGILAHESTTYRRMASDLFDMARGATELRAGIVSRAKELARPSEDQLA